MLKHKTQFECCLLALGTGVIRVDYGLIIRLPRQPKERFRPGLMAWRHLHIMLAVDRDDLILLVMVIGLIAIAFSVW